MPKRWNALQWEGQPGHYEVYYLTFTDPGTGIGAWIRYTMVAPLEQLAAEPSCALWFLAMDPSNPQGNVGEKASFAISELSSSADPFRLGIGSAWLSDHGAGGSIEGSGRHLAWDLAWQPRLGPYAHVHPALRAAKLAKTVLFLPHPDLEISGSIEIDGRRVELRGARGGQAHLWGSKHASRWAWVHCNDLRGLDGGPRRDTFVDGVSVFVPRFGRELGPNTPFVARLGGSDLLSTGPLAVQRNESEFDLTSWRFQARTVRRRISGEVKARKEDLVGVTYHDPDGDLAYCYNTEVADMRLELHGRAAPWAEWQKEDELRSEGSAHFEYAQREPVEGVELKVK